MPKVPALMLLVIAALTLLSAQVHSAWALVNGYVEPAEAGNFYNGDKATLVLNFNTPGVFGNEVMDKNGKFRYDIYATLRLDGNTSVPPKNFSKGVWIEPLAIERPIRIDLNHPLSVGKWIVDVQVFQELEHEMRPDEVNGNPFEIDVFQRPQPDKNWFQLAYENSATLPAALGVTVGGGLFLWWFKRRRTPKPDTSKEKREELQKITDRIHALPPEYMQNLRYHYCKLKNNGRPIDFSYHPKPALRNQADTVEQTLESIAITVLEGAVDYR